MRYLALATDYDGTLADDSRVSAAARAALGRLRDSGRKVLLVTGRELDDLRQACPHLEMFDRVVAENGGVLYRPDTREEQALAAPPPGAFIRTLRERRVSPLSVGRTIVATSEPHEATVLRTIRELGLELQVIFNKGSVMVLPTGVNKASGLAAALAELGLSPHNVVAVGDAENDHAFLAQCECAVAVANALPILKKHADIVTAGDHDRGVIELIDEILADDLRGRENRLTRHHILLGRKPDGGEVRLSPYGECVLLAGPSSSGKSTVTAGLMERLDQSGYQFCIIDPEGDYEELEDTVVLGDAKRVPGMDEVLKLLRQSQHNVVINLLGLPLSDRPLFFAGLLPRLQELRAHTGRPHWVVLDEAHHLCPSTWQAAPASLPQQLSTALLITVHPDMLAPVVLKQVNTVLTVGDDPADTLRQFVQPLGEAPPREVPANLKKGEVLAWFRSPAARPPMLLRTEPPRVERRRHSRKYTEGLLGPDRSFYFHGAEGKLNLRAHNLWMFLELAVGVDDDTWLHHLHRGEYSHWFRDVIGDDALADETAEVERQKNLSVEESRTRIRQAVERRYTAPHNAPIFSEPRALATNERNHR